MALSCYLAMTAGEFFRASEMVENPAWMACQFSSSGQGLSNIPPQFPAGGMIILNDWNPFEQHDPQQICSELKKLWEALSPSCFLLDFQRPGIEEVHTLSRHICQELPCPVVVSHLYAADLDCPVFLPLPPLTRALDAYLAPWNDREIWLEIAPDAALITVAEDGASFHAGVPFIPDKPIFYDKKLLCHYQIEILADCVNFRLERQLADMDALLKCAEELGVSCAVGLYQQFQKNPKR